MAAVISKFVVDLFNNTDPTKLKEEQRTIKELFRFSNTSQETFGNNWSYQSASLFECPNTKVWLVANQTLGAR